MSWFLSIFPSSSPQPSRPLNPSPCKVVSIQRHHCPGLFERPGPLLPITMQAEAVTSGPRSGPAPRLPMSSPGAGGGGSSIVADQGSDSGNGGSSYSPRQRWLMYVWGGEGHARAAVAMARALRAMGREVAIYITPPFDELVRLLFPPCRAFRVPSPCKAAAASPSFPTPPPPLPHTDTDTHGHTQTQTQTQTLAHTH